MIARLAFPTSALAFVAGTSGCLFLVNEPADVGAGGAGGEASTTGTGVTATGDGGGGGAGAACAKAILPGESVPLGLDTELEGAASDPEGGQFAVFLAPNDATELFVFNAEGEPVDEVPSALAPVEHVAARRTGAGWEIWAGTATEVARCRFGTSLGCDEPRDLTYATPVTGLAVLNDLYAMAGQTVAEIDRYDTTNFNAAQVVANISRVGKGLSSSRGLLLWGATHATQGTVVNVCSPPNGSFQGCGVASNILGLTVEGPPSDAVVTEDGTVYAIGAQGVLVRGTPTFAISPHETFVPSGVTSLAVVGDHLVYARSGVLAACCLADGHPASEEQCFSTEIAGEDVVLRLLPTGDRSFVALTSNGGDLFATPFSLD